MFWMFVQYFFRIEDFLNEVFKLWQPKNTCSFARKYILQAVPSQKLRWKHSHTHTKSFDHFSFNFISFFLETTHTKAISHFNIPISARSQIRNFTYFFCVRLCLCILIQNLFEFILLEPVDRSPRKFPAWFLMYNLVWIHNISCASHCVCVLL